MHPTLTCCTLTGVDETTPIDTLIALTEAHPIVEWGILFSPSRQGQPGRYPSHGAIQRILDGLPVHARVALHLCGRAVPDLLDGELTVQALAGRIAARGGRLQFNVNARGNPALVATLVDWLETHPNDVPAITQHNASNAPLLDRLRHRPNHAFLVDASGGRGIDPGGDWPAPQAERWGYAGGLGPDNLAVQLPRIAAAAGKHPVWIDMESRLRDAQDRFDLGAAERCLQAVDTFLAESATSGAA